jgi:hypothetical protein
LASLLDHPGQPSCVTLHFHIYLFKKKGKVVPVFN